MKCPFCQQKLNKDPDGYYTCYTDNCGCWANGGNGASGSESLWLTLIDTKKKLDIAIWGLEWIFGYENVPKYVLQHIRKVLDTINQKEEK